MNIGIIDIGSNTIRLNVYESNKHSFHLLFSKKQNVGLISYINKNNLTLEGINKLNDNIKAYIEKQEQQEKENTTNIFIAFFRFIGLIIKWIFLILFGGLYLIIKVLTGLAK